MMAAEEVVDMKNQRAQRTGVTYGNMRAKLSDYIGQVFECKADSPHYSRRGIAHWRGGARQARSEVRSSGFEVPKTLNFGPRTLGRLARLA
jgi:hypothetical protein